MIRCFISFFIGVSVTYIGNFISYFSKPGGKSTGLYIASAFNNALPDLLFIAGVLVAIVILVWSTLWRISKYNNDLSVAEENARSIVNAAQHTSSDIIAEAHTLASKIVREARDEAKSLLINADKKYNNAERLEIQREQERMDLETEYQKKFAELESREQGYLDEIFSLKIRFERVIEALRNAKKAGCKKLRERGEIAAAERAERKIEKELNAY